MINDKKGVKKYVKIVLMLGILFHQQIFAGQGLWKNPLQVIPSSAKANEKSHLNKTTSITNDIGLPIKGRCFIGAGTNAPIDSGTIKICFKRSTNPDNSGSFCDDWTQVYQMVKVSQDGTFNGVLDVIEGAGSYNVVVYFPPYAIQWWDGSNINSQSSPLNVTGDTVVCNFHFQKGCQLSGKTTRPLGELLNQSIQLFDTCGLQILSTYCDTSGNFEFQCIPVGSYYLYAGDYYPDNASADKAQRFRFDTAGQKIDNVTFNIGPLLSPYQPVGTLIVSKPDTAFILASLIRYFGLAEYSYASTSFPADTMKVNANVRFFVSRVVGGYDPSAISLSYYPGSILRSKADTLTVAPNTTRSVVLPIASGGKIVGGLPIFSNQYQSFEPILTDKDSYITLGGEPYVDSIGNYYMSAPQGLYSLWFVPLTNGYHRSEGWGAFRKDSISVSMNQTAYIFGAQPVQQSGSIEGSVTCREDPLIACFDSLNRCVSITTINLYTYLQEQTGNRWTCFNFSQIYLPPYNIRFAINCLPIGKYSLVLAEPPDSMNGVHKISWYGGPTYLKTIMSPDDVASLQVPNNVAWVKISSIGQTVELSDFNSKILENNKAGLNLNQVIIRQVKPYRLTVQVPKSQQGITLKIFTISGKLISEYNFIKPQNIVVVDLSRLTANKMMVCSVMVDGKEYNKVITLR